MSKEDIMLWGDVVSAMGILPVLLFVFFYGWRSPWRKHLVGRSLMYQSIAMLVVYVIIIVGVWFPELWGREWIRLIGYTFLFATMFRMFFTLLHYQGLPPEDVKPTMHPMDETRRL